MKKGKWISIGCWMIWNDWDESSAKRVMQNVPLVKFLLSSASWNMHFQHQDATPNKLYDLFVEELKPKVLVKPGNDTPTNINSVSVGLWPSSLMTIQPMEEDQWS